MTSFHLVRRSRPPPSRCGRGAHFGGNDIRWGTIASLTLHLAIGVVLMLLPQMRLLSLPIEESISVDILTPGQFEVTTKPALAEGITEPAAVSSSPPSIDKEVPATSKPPEAKPGRNPQPETMIRATQLFSADALADPRSRKAREELHLLASGDRIIQLCNIEAMEQVHRWKVELRPDTLMAYAMAGVRLSDRSVEANGGAFRTGRQWYNIKFKCEVAADLEKVTAFEFLVGDEIPQDQWAAHDLTLGEAED